MTTIDSDSESQDSDDGRRFRFEATRKDDILRLSSQHKRRSPLSKASNYRSRSSDRSSHNRRDYDKTKHNRDKRKISKERDSRDNKHDGKGNNKESRYMTKGNIKDLKESNDSKSLLESEKRCVDSRNSNNRESKDSVRNSSNSKEHKNTKDSRSRESKNSKDPKLREVKDLRDQDLKNSRDRDAKNSRDLEVKDRERGAKRSRDASHERLSAAKHGYRSREKYRSRDRSNNRDKSKQLDGEKSKEESSKNSAHKRNPRKELDRKMVRRDTHSPSKILDQIGSDSESDLGALDPDVGPVMSLDTFEDCREMNLSDFDIISDTEGSSSDTQDTKISAKGPIIKGEILAPHYYGPKITKRVSRRQYERLVRRQAALNTRRLEELYKVNPRNNDATPPLAPSNNNPSAVSDFLLGPEASVSTVRERRRGQKMVEEKHDNSGGDQEPKTKYKSRETSGDEDLTKINSLQIEKLSLVNSNDKEKKSAFNRKLAVVDKHSEYRCQEFVDTQLYGPSLPPKYGKDYSADHDASSAEETVVKKQILATEVASSSRGVRRSRSVDKIPEILTKKSTIAESKTQGRYKNSANTSPTNSCANETRNIVIGPTLPPGIGLKSESPKSESDKSLSTYAPSLPNRIAGPESEEKPVSIIGPSLPPHLQREYSNSATSKSRDSTSPPPDVESSDCSMFGPTLPPYLIPKTKENTLDKSDSDSSDEVLGPMPPNHPAAMDDYIQRQLDERARRMKNKLEAKNSAVEKREEWMLELPSAQKAANLGLSKRQFRNKAGPDMSDRTSWTDTPADKVKKIQDKLLGKAKLTDPARESEMLAIQQRDKAMEKMAEKHASKKRKESLLEIHNKKLHKKKKKEEKEAKEAGKTKPARRPFDRDVDLQANRFDEAQKKSILNKAQLLNDRFSRGESKYL